MVTGISAEGLGMGYGDILVCSGLDLSLRDPGLVCIIGPNGAGKTTLMHALNRLEKPAEGRVVLDGTDLSDMRRSEIARRVAYVPNASEEAFSMTVLDTVLMGRHPLSSESSRRKDLRMAARCLRMLGIQDLAGRRFDALSSGQRQRVMIARGLAQEAEIILLDEPTSNLDLRHQMEVMRLLRDISKAEGLIAVVVCHDINLAARYADRMVLLADGAVKADGTPWEVVTPGTIMEAYGLDCDVTDAGGRPYIVYRGEPRSISRSAPTKFKCELNLHGREAWILFELQVVSNTPMTGEDDIYVVAETFLMQIGYLPKGYDPKTGVIKVRDSVPYRLFMDYLVAHPAKAWTVEDLASLLGTTKPTIYRHINKLKSMDLLEAVDVDSDGQTRKGYRIRYGDLVKAWSFTESNVQMAMENYRKSVAHLQELMKERRE